MNRDASTAKLERWEDRSRNRRARNVPSTEGVEGRTRGRELVDSTCALDRNLCLVFSQQVLHQLVCLGGEKKV